MAYNIIPQRGVFSTIVNLINENFQRIYQQILGLGGSGEQAAEDISQLESDVSALQAGKANDADVVHKAGTETITGNKTFTGTVKLPLQNSGILVTDENGVVQSDIKDFVADVTYEAGDNIFFLKKTVNGTKSNIVPVEVTPNSNSTGLVTSGGIYTALASKADKESPALTGTPTAPTAAAGTNTTQIATTAFVKSAVEDLSDTLTDGTAASELGNVIDVGEYDLMKIKEVKGKSLVWNQRAKNPNPSITNNTEWRAYNNSNVSIEYVDDGVKATILSEGKGYPRGIVANCTGIANTHKILAVITIKPSVTHDFNFETGNRTSAITSCTANQWTKFAGIVTASKNDTQLIVKPATSNLSVNDTFTVRFASCIDLTQMFGAGNEPTTLEEFDALFPDDYYEYNTGEVVGNNVEKLDVYDINNTKKGSLPLNLTELTGKVDGEGTSVAILPDGLHGVGTVYDSLIVDDDGYARRAIKRIGSVDLGSLSWSGFTVNSWDGFYSSGLANIIKNGTTTTPPNVLDKKYKGIPAAAISSTTAGLAVNDKALMVYTNGTIYVRDDDYTTAADFKTAMSGVMLYYELATPIEYVLDTPAQCVAKVYPNGTVKQVPVMPDSTPMVMDVTYLRDNGGMIGGLMNRLDSLEPRIDDLAKGIKTISVQYGDATNIVLETEKINGKESTVSIPAATSQAAGAMSAAQAALLEDLSDLADDIETLLASI